MEMVLFLGEAGNGAQRANEAEERQAIQLCSPSGGSNHWSLDRSLLEPPTVIGVLAVEVQGYHSKLWHSFTAVRHSGFKCTHTHGNDTIKSHSHALHT